MRTSGITAALPAQDLGRAKAFYAEKAVIHVTDVRAAVAEMRGRGVEFEEYDTPEIPHDPSTEIVIAPRPPRLV